MFKASIENRGNSKYYATTRHSAFVLDTEGDGANPVDTLLASLCGCLSHYIRDFLVEQRISHNGFTVDSEANITPDKARLGEISVRIDLKGAVLTDRQSADLLEFVENCKVNKILKVNPGVVMKLV
ncbi:OsmC family protein [Geobacter sp. SVR]|uniref:OsmC family protein n=1 Tax=Geobacter sp. SVR TaxID=2495594 RepID=UPI00143EF699|nr:OsmC family protein [Geobacter sp. SVR]BCS55213.1 hypothetical protein GSVR_35210 [Geobacter sp. SVR]GCF86014.1 hypothetical protein GSbR_26140 [Geobacter sp. SVR]